MNEMMEYASELFSRIEQGVIDIAPDALNLALAVVRVDGAGALLVGLCFLVIAAFFFYFGRRNWLVGMQEDEYEDGDSEKAQFYLVSGAILQFVAGLASIGFFSTWFDIWNWAKLFVPELGLAKQIIELLAK